MSQDTLISSLLEQHKHHLLFKHGSNSGVGSTAQSSLARASVPIGIPQRPGTPPIPIPPRKHSLVSSSASPESSPRVKSLDIGLCLNEEDENTDEASPEQRRQTSFSPASPPASPIRRTSFSSSLPVSFSPSEIVVGSFVGSFEESLLSGHMSNTPSISYPGFVADLGACAPKFLPEHVQIPFSALYYLLDYETPYVGRIELPKKGYRIASKGLIQVTVSNPSHTPVKTFLVKYDLSDMPPMSKTFLRQKIVTNSESPVLRYAIHLKVVSPKKSRFYLYDHIRVVFPTRQPDEQLQTTYHHPVEPKYYSYE